MSHKTGIEDYYVIKNNKRMRFGFTTGTCAATASKAAVKMLLSGDKVDCMDIHTPKGIDLNIEINDAIIESDYASCYVIKDAGDDPDVTDGIRVYAKAEKTDKPGCFIDGGTGVGRVTKKGLEQPVGNAAINRVPRSMITREVEDMCSEYDYEGGIAITISIPEGVEIGKRTFNPRLGIVGGISVLGTSGIVEPMSEDALIRSIGIEMRQRIENGAEYLLVTPGNYGVTFVRENTDLPADYIVKCSNYVGETIDMAVSMGAKGILFVSHIGKFAKVAAGIMNTHSRSADARAEIMAANAIRAGIGFDSAKEILDTLTTDEALEIIEREGLLDETIHQITDRISFYLRHRSYDRLETGAILFSNQMGYLGRTCEADYLSELIRNQKVSDD